MVNRLVNVPTTITMDYQKKRASGENNLMLAFGDFFIINEKESALSWK